MKKEIYFSLDIETDGAIPGRNSMLSFALAAFEAGNEEPLGLFTANLEKLPGAIEDEDTAAFWKENQEAYQATRECLVEPAHAMENLRVWVTMLCQRHDAKPVCVAYPATFDFMFLYWYLRQFGDLSPFGFSALDMKTLAFSQLGGTFREASKRNFKSEWLPKEFQHTHVALDDAIEQGVTFIRILSDVNVDPIYAEALTPG